MYISSLGSMDWVDTLNADSSDASLTQNKGREITLSDSNTYSFELPDDDVAVDDQEYFLIVNISNASQLDVKTYTSRPSGTQSTIRAIVNSVAIHFIFDGTNNKWRIISDDKVKSIEDADNPLSAMSGNLVKDQYGNLVEQAGVTVVGINTINGNAVFAPGDDITVGKITGDDIVVGTLNSGSSTISGLTVENYALVNGGLTVTMGLAVGGTASISGDLTVNGGSALTKHVITPSTGENLYEIIDRLYGIPSSGNSKSVNISCFFDTGTYMYNYCFNHIYHDSSYPGQIRLIGYYTIDTASYANRYMGTLSNQSTFLNGYEVTFYV